MRRNERLAPATQTIIFLGRLICVNPMRRKTTLSMALGLGLLTLAGSCAAPVQVEPESAGGALPEFRLQELGGERFTHDDLEGKVALINFWATWCGPCKIEMPWFVDFQRQFKDRGFTVLAISLDEGGWDPVRAFAEEMDFNFPVVLGGDPVSEAFGGIYVLPTTLIVNRSGEIVYRHSGLIPKATYEEEIESLL